MTLRGGPRQERRRHPRAIANFSAVLTVKGRGYAGRIVNLSMGGALLDLGDMSPEPGITAGVRLTLDIRCRGGDAAGPLHVEGRAVLWNSAGGDIPLLAVQFDPLDDERAEVLEDLMFEALSELRGREITATRH